MKKWMVEFLRKFESRGDKISRVNSIRITKSVNLLSFCTMLQGVRCDVDIFKLTARGQSIYREVDGSMLLIFIQYSYNRIYILAEIKYLMRSIE